MHESVNNGCYGQCNTETHKKWGLLWVLHLCCSVCPAGGRPRHMCLGCYFKSMLDLFDEILQSSLFVRLQYFITESGVLLLNLGMSIQNALHFSLLLSLFMVKGTYFPCYLFSLL